MTQLPVFVEKTGRRIAPFLDPIGETPILNRPLHEWQADAFRAGGLVPVESLQPPCVVVPDTLFTNGGALRAFVEGAAGRDAVLLLKRSAFGTGTAPVQPEVVATEAGLRFDCIRFVSGQDQAPVAVEVDPQETVFELALPHHLIGQDKLRLGVPRNPVMTLHHWLHVLRINQLAGGWQMRTTPLWKLALRGLWAVLRAHSFNKWKVLGKLNRIGRGCDIHPTATVEGSTLGDNVGVGPYARVLFSTLGDGVQVLPGAQVEGSVLGARALVCQHSVVRFCLLYPGAVAGQYLLQQCVLGRDVLTTGGAFTLDINLEGEVRVELDGALHPTGTPYLGAAFGHRCRIGTGFWLACGRAVPNDYYLVRDPQKILSKLPEGFAPATPLVANEHVLRPLEE